jgi:maltooligosyltrehalose trehalohydrolase
MTVFEVWAPAATQVRLALGAAALPGDDPAVHPMSRGADGWWHVEAVAPPGTDYGFLLDDDPSVLPDPRTRWQPDGVHGRSRVYDQSAFAWTDDSWTGRTLPGAVIYELHIGTFTPGGTFDSAVERLDHLVTLGITHVELLPVNAVNGTWNWGYDGVDWYAVHDPYGGPDGLKRFVDACHRRGLAVLLDVVYNHLGPSGNYLPRFGPYLQTGGRNTWGDLVNLDGPDSAPVRRFIIENALMWLGDFHVDGLRIDAVHALKDASPVHVLAELSTEVAALEAHVRRPLPLIAESDLNDPAMVAPRSAGGYGMDGQWDDDVHHALHTLLTGEHQGYYSDFGTLAVLAKVLTSAFLHDGTYSSFRERPHGRPVDRATTAGFRFVVCLQNHDQVGNRAVGDRLSEVATRGMLEVGAVLLLTSPYTPMLWMGEEWAATTRWPFFTSHPEPELAEATARGRIEEFSGHGWDIEEMIDPQDPRAYETAVLAWDEVREPDHARMLDLYRGLIGLRHDHPELSDPRLDRVDVSYDEDARWFVVQRGSLRVLVNFAAAPQTVPVGDIDDVLFSTGDVELTGAGAVLGAESAAIVSLRT